MQALGGFSHGRWSSMYPSTSAIRTKTVITRVWHGVIYLCFVMTLINKALLYKMPYTSISSTMNVILLTLFAIVSAGCTVVNVEGGRVHHYAGTLRIEPNSGAQLVSVSSKSWGLAVDGRSMLIGYGRSRTVIVPPYSTCSIIIFAEPNSSMPDDWRRFFITYPNACLHGEQ